MNATTELKIKAYNGDFSNLEKLIKEGWKIGRVENGEEDTLIFKLVNFFDEK